MKHRVEQKGPAKKKRLDILISVGAFVLFLLLGVGALIAMGNGAAGPVDLEFTLLHTNDTWGYIEPCG